MMVLFLSILGWNLLESLGQSVEPDRYTTCTKKDGPAGVVPVASPMPKSVSLSRKGKRSAVDGFVIAYLSSMELLGNYHG